MYTPTDSCDILVAGAGIAGLSFALHVAKKFPQKRIVVISKGSSEDSNSYFAQGGVAAVMDETRDSFESHIDDTMRAGDGLNRRDIVEMVVREAPEQMRQLMNWGVPFDYNPGGLDLAREGGHSAARVLHCKDHSGKSIMGALFEQCESAGNIEFLWGQFADALLLDVNGRCVGLRLWGDQGFHHLIAPYTMLATGGAGQVYLYTSNPPTATGDGMALAIQAGVAMAQMSFVQFHPTVLQHPQGDSFLISEAVRGFGALVRNLNGDDFLKKHHPSGSLATRDIVARGIFMEMLQSGAPHVGLDLRHLDQKEFRFRFPTIAAKLSAIGLNPATELIPVAPAAHYFCGGVLSDSQGHSSMSGLLVAGECACTGLHGANRLASNSLLEALVFSKRAADSLDSRGFPMLNPADIAPVLQPGIFPDLIQARTRLKKLMFEKVGIVRNFRQLREAREEIRELRGQIVTSQDVNLRALEYDHMLHVANAVVEDALKQTENRGTYYNSDLLPETSEMFRF